MKRSSAFKIVYSALFAALIFLGTQFIKVPLAAGYFNLGDTFVLLSGYFVGGVYGAMSSAVGSVLADILSGYIVYAPATLVIKSAMSLIVFAFCRNSQKNRLRFIISSILAEMCMALGYLIFDSLLYGFSGAWASFPSNLLQGLIAIILGTVIVLSFKKEPARKG